MGSPTGLRGERPQGLQHRTSRRRMLDEDWNLENQAFCSCRRQTQNDPMTYGYARGSTESQSVEAQVRQLRPPVPGKCPGLVLLVSPSLRQSRELFAKVISFLKELEPPLAEKFRSNTVDPVTALERVRSALRALQRSADGSFAVPLYDGARRFDILGHILPKRMRARARFGSS